MRCLKLRRNGSVEQLDNKIQITTNYKNRDRMRGEKGVGWGYHPLVEDAAAEK